MTTLLPPNATTLERNAAAAMAALGDIPVPLRDLMRPVSIPAAVLPWLAWHMSVDGWDEVWTDAQRRAVIASSYQVHRQKGTAGAVRAAIAALGLSAEIYEWWQESPRAAPHTFRVEVDDVGVTPELMASVQEQVTATKPVRSHFTVQLIARPKDTLYMGVAYQDTVTTTIYPKP
jgi:phage tail P2-like protein